MRMKIFSVLVMGLMALNIISAKDDYPKQIYANLVFTVFELDNVKTGLAAKINMPIPEVYTSSWIHAHFSLDITEKKLSPKTIEKEDYRFSFLANSKKKISVRVMYKGQERFHFEHSKPSTAHYIFYGPDNRIFLMEVLFTTADHRTGPLGPGIRKGESGSL